MILNNQLLTFPELTVNQLYQILRLRSEVFVQEQNCAYLDVDGLDQQALHLLSFDETQQLVAYARILTPEQNQNAFSCIGRVVVSKKKRQQNLGYHLMEQAIHQTLQKFPNLPIKISAQTYLSKFYQSLGFINTGHFYLEDNIPHQEMVYQP
ncbi:MAG: GNAT family N-acetyltransferase [Marinicella sp.]